MDKKTVIAISGLILLFLIIVVIIALFSGKKSDTTTNTSTTTTPPSTTTQPTNPVQPTIPTINPTPTPPSGGGGSLPVPSDVGKKGIYIQPDTFHNFNGYFIYLKYAGDQTVFGWVDSPNWTHSLYPANLGKYIPGRNQQIYFFGPPDNSGNVYQLNNLGKNADKGNALECNITLSNNININNDFATNAVATLFLDVDSFHINALYKDQLVTAVVNQFNASIDSGPYFLLTSDIIPGEGMASYILH